MTQKKKDVVEKKEKAELAHISYVQEFLRASKS